MSPVPWVLLVVHLSQEEEVMTWLLQPQEATKSI